MNDADRILMLRAAVKNLITAAADCIERREHEYKRAHYVTLEAMADEGQTALDETE